MADIDPRKNMPSSAQIPVLGRGLAALFSNQHIQQSSPFIPTRPLPLAPDHSSTPGEKVYHILHVPISHIQPGFFQPRTQFSDESLEELAQSISIHGVLQPIILRPLPAPSEHTLYEIVAGERRWRASQLAKCTTIPALVRALTDQEAVECGILENIQRQDLLPIDEAKAYQRLIEQFAYTHAMLSQILGKSRSHITNMLRLLMLPEMVQRMVQDKYISTGHARLLVGKPYAEKVAEHIMAQRLSVRETERYVASLERREAASSAQEPAFPGAGPTVEAKEMSFDSIAEMLSEMLHMPVHLVMPSKRTAGSIRIVFEHVTQLDQLLAKLMVGLQNTPTYEEEPCTF